MSRDRHGRATHVLRLAAVVVGLAATTACRQDMQDQPTYEAQEAGPFFADGRASRPPVEGTVARDELALTDPAHTGKRDGVFLAHGPRPIGRALLERGRQRFDIFCSPCHDRAGTGGGMIVQRGFRHPPSLLDPRLRAAADGYLFDVITNGFGVMPPYGAQVPAGDRWAIVAYVRALQLSQDAPASALTAAERARLDQESP